MTDKEFKAQKLRIKKLTKKWHSDLGLGWYQVRHTYHRVRQEAGTPTAYAPKAIKGVWETPMSVVCDPNYGMATINYHLPVCAELDDAELEDTFLHECMHIFLSPLRTGTKLSGAEESVATRLAYAVKWVREGALKKKTK